MSEDRIYFDHKKLKVYQNALGFVEFTHELCIKIDYRSDIRNQFERASNSIVLNIAEGNGKYSPKDKCRYFDIAIGSSFECSACLDIMLRKKIITEVQLKNGKQQLKEIVAMLVGLIKSKSERVYEDDAEYKS